MPRPRLLFFGRQPMRKASSPWRRWAPWGEVWKLCTIKRGGGRERERVELYGDPQVLYRENELGKRLPGSERSRKEGTMSRKGCLSVTKYFLFIFNLLFFILGSLLFSFGLWILFDRNSFASVLGSSYYALKVWSYIFCGVGILTMLIGFLGCLGSLKEIKCMLGFYFTFLLLLFIAQITIGILIYTQRHKLRETVGDYVHGIIATYGTSEPLSDHDESWDFVQEQLQCCGWKSFSDWENNDVVRNSSGRTYPCSCRNVSRFDPFETNHTASLEPSGFCNAQGRWPVYTEGCMDSVEIWLTNNIITIVGICLGIALLELCLMMLSMFLCRTIDPDYYKLTRYS